MQRQTGNTTTLCSRLPSTKLGLVRSYARFFSFLEYFSKQYTFLFVLYSKEHLKNRLYPSVNNPDFNNYDECFFVKKSGSFGIIGNRVPKICKIH